MVVFTCETCYATLKKNQVDKHCEGKCRSAWHFTCVECGKTFGGFEYKEHNECMTEVQKYQGIFIQKQRELKQVLKQQEKDKKNGNNAGAEETKDEVQPETDKTKALRKFLKSGKGFKGWADTAEELLEEVKNLFVHLIVERETNEGKEIHQEDHQDLQTIEIISRVI